MPSDSRRGFTILDAMVLLAAMASGFAISKAIGGLFYLRGSQLDAADPLFERVVQYVPGLVHDVIAPILTMTSFAILILGRIPPRPSWRRWVRQPGVLGPLAIVVAIAIDGGVSVAITAASPRREFRFLETTVAQWIRIGSFALVASWLTLRLSGRWRRPLAWPGRAGVWLGIAWLACWAASISCAILYQAIRTGGPSPAPAPPSGSASGAS